MKLKTKLIPVFGLAATGVAAMPLMLTGCSNGWLNYQVNLLDKFTPTTEQHEHESSVTKSAVLGYYLEEASTNPNLFYEDMIWSKSKFIQDLILPYYSSNDSMVIRKVIINSLSNVGMTIENVVCELTEDNIPLLSFDMKYGIKFDVEYEAAGERDVGLITCEINVTKLPYDVVDNTYERQPASLWFVAPYREVLMDPTFTGWQIKYNLDLHETQTYKIGGFEIVTDVTDNYDYIFDMLTVQSWIAQGIDYDFVPYRILDALCYPESLGVSKALSFNASREARISDLASLCVFTLAGSSWYLMKLPHAY